ncbi:YfcC family protein [Robertmurraya massiliosenegalensis]|uniref:YfcC family protein n=1 Tax=Robertmurraya massiliosenegalensis TaxID=1287657 RepID=UPI00031BBFE7|nr:AbgT family transporter [Robertmurraya massiliosenegalensis]
MMPDTYVVLFLLMIVCAIATYVIPAGEFERIEKDGITIVDPESYQQVEKTPVGIADVFLSYPLGMIDTANIIILILFIGGAFRVMEASGAVNAGIMALINKLENRKFVLITILGILFSFLCTTGFSSNATIAFIPIGILIAKALKLDAIAGVAIVFLTSMAGFNTAFLNPKTLGVAQEIAELPMFSGLTYRVILYVIFAVATIIYVIWYCNRILKDPSKSFMGEQKFSNKDQETSLNKDQKFTTRHALILLLFVAGIAFYVYGSLTYDFGMNDMTAIFVVIAIGAGIIARMNSTEIVNNFMEGAQNLVYGALVVGAARAIVFILEDGRILDTVILAMSNTLEPLSPITGAIGMLFANGLFNFFVPSGSGQAVVTMPIWTPLADILDINRQVAVQAFQLGDGFTNSLFPTSGILMASLAIGGVPYSAWLKFIWRIMLIWFVLGAIALAIGQLINWGPM